MHRAPTGYRSEDEPRRSRGVADVVLNPMLTFFIAGVTGRFFALQALGRPSGKLEPDSVFNECGRRA